MMSRHHGVGSVSWMCEPDIALKEASSSCSQVQSKAYRRCTQTPKSTELSSTMRAPCVALLRPCPLPRFANNPYFAVFSDTKDPRQERRVRLSDTKRPVARTRSGIRGGRKAIRPHKTGRNAGALLVPPAGVSHPLCVPCLWPISCPTVNDSIDGIASARRRI